MTTGSVHRSLELTPERLVAYSRSGNFHSDPEAAARLGYPGMVAQGMQVAGPAYGLLLDAWGEELLRSGEIELKFVGVVSEGQTVTAECRVDDDGADLEVSQGGRTVTVGRAARRAPGR